VSRLDIRLPPVSDPFEVRFLLIYCRIDPIRPLFCRPFAADQPSVFRPAAACLPQNPTPNSRRFAARLLPVLEHVGIPFDARFHLDAALFRRRLSGRLPPVSDLFAHGFRYVFCLFQSRIAPRLPSVCRPFRRRFAARLWPNRGQCQCRFAVRLPPFQLAKGAHAATVPLCTPAYRGSQCSNGPYKAVLNK
jgi:hypothetical protein